MSCFLVRWEGGTYANDELFVTAIAGGPKAFMEMLNAREVIGKKLFDQTLYPVTGGQQKLCEPYNPPVQDFDAAYRQINVVSKDVVKRVKEKMDAGYPGATVVTIDPAYAPPLFPYRHANFFKVLDYKATKKYPMVPKMAVIKLCGRLYVALNAVSVRAETPIIVTIGK
jgi:hypothetical protein